MKILFANYCFPYPLHFSGADIANHVFLKELQKKGHQIKLLFYNTQSNIDEIRNKIINHTELTEEQKEYLLKKDLTGAATETCFNLAISKLKKAEIPYKFENNQITFTFDDLTFTITGENFYKEYERLSEAFLPEITYLSYPLSIEKFRFFDHSKYIFLAHTPEAFTIFTPVKDQFHLLIAVSETMKKKLLAQYNRPTEVVFPVPDLAMYQVAPTPAKQKYITIINPILEKGGAIVEKLIAHFTEKQFLLLEGWQDPIEQGLDFKKYPNVTYLKNTTNMKPVYAETRLILIPTQPSLFIEGCGRVSLEASGNLIPQIASRNGALPELIKNNGIIIDIPEDLESWISAIEKMDDPIFYDGCKDHCDIVNNKFSLPEQVDKLERLFQQLL